MIFPKMHGCPLGGLGALGHLFGGSGAHNWSQKRILGYIISSLVMKLYVCWWTCLCMCIHCVLWVCVGEYIQTYIDVHICLCESIFIHNLCIDAYLQICRYASMHIYLYSYLYIYRYTHICIYIYIYIHVYIYIYIHIYIPVDSQIPGFLEFPRVPQSCPRAPRAFPVLPELWESSPQTPPGSGKYPL